MKAERYCIQHAEPLDGLHCAYQHGTKWDNKTRKKIPNFQVSEWLYVEDGIVVAEVSVDRVRWLRQPFDGGTRKLAGRERDGTGGRPWGLDMGMMR